MATNEQPKNNPIRSVDGVSRKPEKGMVTKAIELVARKDVRALHEDVRRGTIPKLYGFIRDILHTVIDSTFNGGGYYGNYKGYGGSYYSSSPTRYGNPSYLNSYYGNQNNGDQPGYAITRTPRFTCNDVIMRDWASAEDLLNSLRENIAAYGSVSIAELYDAMYPNDDGPFDIEFNDHYYGWKNLDDIQMRSVPGGVQLMLPKPIQIR